MKKSYLGQRWLMIPIKQAINSWSPLDQRGRAGLKSPSSSSQSVRVLCGSIRRGAGLTSICPLLPLQPQGSRGWAQGLCCALMPGLAEDQPQKLEGNWLTRTEEMVVVSWGSQ